MNDIFQQRFAELEALVLKNPFFIPIQVAADFLHMGADNLRASIEQGMCPFGFSWKSGNRTAYKIPSLTFASWVLKGDTTYLGWG